MQPIITECFTPDFNGKGSTYKFDLGTSLSGYEKMQIAGNMVQYVPRKTVAQGAQEGDVTLTISIDCPETWGSPTVSIYNADTSYLVRPYQITDIKNIPVTIAPGTYDVFVSMFNDDMNKSDVIKELVEITEDKTITFDMNDASNHIMGRKTKCTMVVR